MSCRENKKCTFAASISKMKKSFCIIISILLLNNTFKALIVISGLYHSDIKSNLEELNNENKVVYEELPWSFFLYRKENIVPDKSNIYAVSFIKQPINPCGYYQLNNNQKQIGFFLFEADISPPYYI